MIELTFFKSIQLRNLEAKLSKRKRIPVNQLQWWSACLACGRCRDRYPESPIATTFFLLMQTYFVVYFVSFFFVFGVFLYYHYFVYQFCHLLSVSEITTSPTERGEPKSQGPMSFPDRNVSHYTAELVASPWHAFL